MPKVTIDFETRSAVDLKRCGTSAYARHPSTQILCLAFAVSNRLGQVSFVWKAKEHQTEFLRELFDVLHNGCIIEAHNVFFERMIWKHLGVKRLGWPPISDSQWRCSLAACSRLGLPRSLDQASAAMGLDARKDKEGKAVMMRLAKPIPTKDKLNHPQATFDNDPEKFEKLYAYCAQDVLAECAISDAIEPLPDSELAIWQLDQRINERGLRIDVEAVQNAIAVASEAQSSLAKRLAEITGGHVESATQVESLKAFLIEITGRSISSLSAESVKHLISDDSLPPIAREALSIRQLASKASIAKLPAMLERADEDGRVRGNLVYHGAATGRWAGTGIQIQNFPRGTLSATEVDLVHQVLPRRDAELIELLLGSPIDSIASCLRSFIVAGRGKRLLVCDFASIEARVLAWVAGEEELVKAFVDGADAYKALAKEIYEIDIDSVTKSQRQVGKVAVLGLGYGMGFKTFIYTCKVQAGIAIDRKFSKRVVAVYRETNPHIKKFWGLINKACLTAIRTGEDVEVGKTIASCDETYLRIELPSGRCLHYRHPKIVKTLAPWSDAYRGFIGGDVGLQESLEAIDIELGQRDLIGNFWRNCIVPRASARKLKQLTKKFRLVKCDPEYLDTIEFSGVATGSGGRRWSRIRTYGAKLTENIVQAIARDFLAEAMLRVESAGYQIVATVHDEILAEMPDGKGTLEEFESMMAEVPPWGNGCPIGVEGYESVRYRK